MTVALHLEGVRADYGLGEVLHGIDVVVPAGKSVALLGANGAGKTTLLKVAAGQLRPTGGQVWLDGRRVERLRDHALSRLGLCLLPEGRGIFRQLSVRDNLVTFAGKGRAAEAVEQAGAVFPVLVQRLNQVAGTLSGGEQQMLAISRALVGDARVVLADELSLGLAPIVVDGIFAALEALRSQNRSLLIVEQYVHRALAIADYVYILHKGSVVFVGEPEQCQDETVFERYLGSMA